MLISFRIGRLPYFPFMFSALLAALMVVGAGCSSTTDPTDAVGLSGTLTYEEVMDGVEQFDLATHTATGLYVGRSPSSFSSGAMVVLGPTSSTMEIVSANGTARNEIYSSPRTYTLFGPKVSPSGTMIAFTESAETEVMSEPRVIKTVVIDLDGNVIVEINGLGAPSWTTDGRILLSGSWLYPYSLTSEPITPNGESAIYIVDAAFTGVTQISGILDKPLDPSMSPDGSRIALTLNGHLWTMKSDGTDLKQITTGSKSESKPTWSPDGKNIVCVCFGTFESLYYNAIAIVPAAPTSPTAMNNDASVWVIDKNQTLNVSKGRVHATGSIGWR
ncbi:MAG TPA: hypothetical protein VK147_08580 [Candidatus Didemnitutus sp.]|nr:hypothetical protein [Candidatus Didemnitutus sp.]